MIMFKARKENFTYPVGVLGEIRKEITEKAAKHKHYQYLPVESEGKSSFNHLS